MKLFARFSTAGALWIALLFGVGVVAAPALLTGCGGDESPDKKKGGKKKGGKKKGGKKKGGKKKGDPKEEGSQLSEKELEINEFVVSIKEEGNLMLTEGFNHKEAEALRKKVAQADKRIAELGGDSTGEWEKLILTLKDMLFAKPMQDLALGYCNAHAEEFDSCIKRLEKDIAYLKGVKGDEAPKVVARLGREIEIIQSLKVWVAKTPQGEMDLLAGGKSDWEIWGNELDSLQSNFSADEITLSRGGGKSYAYITAKHAYWKDYIAVIHLTIEKGEVTVIHRHIPGRPSTHFHAALDAKTFQGRVELTFEMMGPTLKIIDPEGNIMDTIPSEKGNPGGGITFRINPNSNITIHKITVEAR
jgi:hypothetical protein